MVNTTMIRMFQVEAQAEKFAREHHGKVQVRYDWDDMRRCIVKYFVVKY